MTTERLYIQKKKAAVRKQRRASSLLIGAGSIILAVALVLLVGNINQSVDTNANTGGLPQISSVTPVSVNFPAPELSLRTLTGDWEALSDYRGQVVLINNWAIWCPPCKAELPHLEAYYQRHMADGFTIIGIEAGDPVPQVSDFVQTAGLSFPIWLDLDQAALNAFQNGALPNSYVIDKAGQVRLAWTGTISESMLEAYVTPLLAE